MERTTSKVLTIIVPTYNMELYLNRCLLSLVLPKENALMERTEVLVIIDGATDRSKDIALGFQEQYPETFRVIEKENGNYGSCVNRGLKEAQGKYVKILDSDDSFDTESYASFLERLQSLDTDLVVSSGTFVNVDNQAWGNWQFGYEADTVYEVEDLKPLWIHYVTYRTELLRSVGYHQTEGISYTDEEWCFYPILAVRNFYSLHLLLYRYTVGREGQTMEPRKWIISASQEVKVTMGFFQYIENNESWKNSRASLYLQKKLFARVSSFYQKMLIEYGLYENENLLFLDDYLRTRQPRIYNQLNDVVAASKRIRFHYIMYWRKHRPLNSRYNLFRLYRAWIWLRGFAE